LISPGLGKLLTAEQKQLLFGNTARAIADAPKDIKIRHIGNCLKADPAYGKGVADTIGIQLSEIPK
jgi:catalase